MYSDIMYCKTCGILFMDCWRGHDTNTERLLITNCPSCRSMHTMNVDGFIKDYEQSHRTEQYKASYTILYNHLKHLRNVYIHNKKPILLDDIYLTRKEHKYIMDKV